MRAQTPTSLAVFLVPLVLLAAPRIAAATAEPPLPAAAPPAPPAEPLPAGFADAAHRLIEAARHSDYGYGRLESLCDEVGARPSGSPAYDKAAAWAITQMKALGLSNVHLEDVTIDAWQRGREALTMLEPVPRAMTLLGLGGSVATPQGGITAEALVVGSFDELDKLGDAAKGKIVVYDFPMHEVDNMFDAYGEAVAYRSNGASRAAAHGAVAALVRSVTTRSLSTPHTGMMGYDAAQPKIPAAAITTEDAAALHRLATRKIKIALRLDLESKPLPGVKSYNVVGELPGRERPGEIVVAGGHLDSWDVGCGAHDDGAGVAMSLDLPRLFKETGLVPRRTVRIVLYAHEEHGGWGGRAYFAQHEAEVPRHAGAIESDSGGFRPIRLGVSSSEAGIARFGSFGPLFAALGPLAIRKGGGGADIGPLCRAGVPCVGLGTDSTHYFDYHHSPADTLDKVDLAEFRDATAAMAVATWLLAELPEPLPRDVPPKK